MARSGGNIRHVKSLPAFICVLLCAAAAAQVPREAPAHGVIYGTVFDLEGQPAKEIGLMAMPLGVPLGTALPYAKTDQNGRYRFPDIPWWGRYTVYAEDEAAGYSMHATYPIDLRNSIEEVTLSPEHPEAEFNLHLPPKAGFLQFHLTNKRTGKAIEAVQVTIFAAYNAEQLLFSQSCSSTRAILIPPDKDLLLHVTSSGFREWSQGVGAGMPIRAHPGEQVKLGVELDPLD